MGTKWKNKTVYILKQTIDCKNQVMIIISLDEYTIAYSLG